MATERERVFTLVQLEDDAVHEDVDEDFLDGIGAMKVKANMETKKAMKEHIWFT